MQMTGAARLSRSLLCCAALCMVAMASSAGAQSLPRNVQILVSTAPGGPVDIVARILGNRLAARTGGTAVALNRPGANGLLAANALLQAKPDGETLMVTGQGLMTISAHIQSLPFDPLRDLTAISGLAYADSALVVGKRVPASNLRDFVQLAKKSQPPLALGSGGTGNITHLYIERLKDLTKVDFLHVPYKGVGPALQDVLGGRIDGLFIGLVGAMPQIKAGQLKALGVIGDKRSPLLPDIPTLAEQGYPILDIGWFALIGPPRMRPELTQALAAEFADILAEEETRAELAKLGLNPWPKNADQLTRVMHDESARWAQLIREHNIKE